jgi:cell division protein FtsB
VLTRRAAVLASAVCAVVLLLAYPLREYASQRGEINALRAQSAAASRQVAALAEQQRRWQDPAYVKAQARERLHYVMPGETPYVILRGGPAPSTTPTAHSSAGGGASSGR